MSADPTSTLASMAETLALDGYRLEVVVIESVQEGTPGQVELKVVPTDGACAECLIPKPIFTSMVLDRLGTQWTVDVDYPKEA